MAGSMTYYAIGPQDAVEYLLTDEGLSKRMILLNNNALAIYKCIKSNTNVYDCSYMFWVCYKKFMLFEKNNGGLYRKRLPLHK